jgi:hypothetical protein
VKHSRTLTNFELNPIASVLITQEETQHRFLHAKKNDITVTTFIYHEIYTDVSKLILFKVLGLVASLEIFDWLINSKYTKSTTFIILVISLTQLSLLIFLLI